MTSTLKLHSKILNILIYALNISITTHVLKN